MTSNALSTDAIPVPRLNPLKTRITLDNLLLPNVSFIENYNFLTLHIVCNIMVRTIVRNNEVSHGPSRNLQV